MKVVSQPMQKNTCEKCGKRALTETSPARCSSCLSQEDENVIEKWREKLIQKASSNQLNNAYLAGAPLSDLTWPQEAKLINVDFSGADLLSSTFIKVNLSHSIFRGADLSYTKAQSSIIRYADFSGANFFAANFAYSHVAHAIFHRTKYFGLGTFTIPEDRNICMLGDKDVIQKKDIPIMQETADGYKTVQSFFSQANDFKAMDWAQGNYFSLKERIALKQKKIFTSLFLGYMRISCRHAISLSRLLLWAFFLITYFAVAFSYSGFLSNGNILNSETIFFQLLDSNFKEAIVSCIQLICSSAGTFTTLGFLGLEPASLQTKIFAFLEAGFGAITIAQLVWIIGRRYQNR